MLKGLTTNLCSMNKEFTQLGESFNKAKIREYVTKDIAFP
jgi:hypothetical protein